MLESLPSLLAPLLVLLVFLFLFFRLGYFASRELGGRAAFVSGSVLIFAASMWQALKVSEQYYTWFVDPAYPIIDVVQFSVLALGLLSVVGGLALYADFWQTRREDLDARQGRLSMLENLQHDARQPYHLLELLNLALREVLSHVSSASGAVFLANPKQRRLVLTTASGLTKQETAALEYYPMGRNIVTQALEIGDPMLTSRFEFIDRHGATERTRFESCLILPMTSGLDKIGVILLFSEQKQYFSRTDIRYLAPVAGWLAEKIRAARLTRELAQARTETAERREESSDLVARYSAAGAAAASGDAANSFCGSLVGFLESESVYLCGLRQGGLVFHGGSESLNDVSENYRTALLDAIDRPRPLIINQEAADEAEQGSVAVSSLVYPLGEAMGHNALVFVRSGKPFSVGDRELKQIESVAGLARLVLINHEHQRLRLTRRKGFDAILTVLKSDAKVSPVSERPSAIIDYLAAVLPTSAVCLAFRFTENAGLSPAYGSDGGREVRLEPISLHVGEGAIGQAAATGECSYAYGRRAVLDDLSAYSDDVRGWFSRLWGERGVPIMLAHCPVVTVDRTEGVAFMALYDIDEKERAEWQRLLTLATGLFSFRLTLDAVTRQAAEAKDRAADSGMQPVSPDEKGTGPAASANTLGKAIRDVLAQAHVSGSLYMAGQRPREIDLRLADTSDISFSSEHIRKLFESALNRFSTLAQEDDVITLATYEREGFVYLDVSRHRHNFPPVESVADFGRYQLSEEAYRQRPGDIFLRHAAEGESFYAVDLDSLAPAYLSFKFPVAAGGDRSGRDRNSPVRILAADDQQVILDLITAMGQSLGYRVTPCDTAQAAWNHVVSEERYDVLLVGQSLPDMPGLDLIQRLRQLRPDVKAILISGWESPVDRDRLARLGVTDVLFKPFRIEQLTEIVQSAVTNRANS